ncbi:adenine deaminase [soil metagenome]
MASVKGNIVDILKRRMFFGEVVFNEGRIQSIAELQETIKPDESYIMPGFIDSHVHIESSMLVPSEFAKMAVVHGTVGTISDPHEIANVCGMPGVEFMIANGKTVPFKFHFGAPSCVPATIFETAGAALTADEVDILLQKDDISYLSEMMNFPGVLNAEAEVMKKIASAKKYNKPVDGHAPGLRGDAAKKYIDAGISTDHECFTEEEAFEKLQYGMKILIREGSAAKNFEALIPLMHEHYEHMMFCSDDKHPDSLADGHINDLCARAVAKQIDIYKVLQAACINPVVHYKMNIGLLNNGNAADFIVVKDLTHFKVLQTYINGQVVAENGKSKISSPASSLINHFHCDNIKVTDLIVKKSEFTGSLSVIEALDGQLITNNIYIEPKVEGEQIVSDIENDVLKMVVINRYQKAPVAKAFIKNFGFKKGAIASSVAHDSHNIIAVGADDESMCRAINSIIDHEGGISCVSDGTTQVLPLPVAGLMSNDDGYKVAVLYTAIDKAAKELGSNLSAPFMTLSFMALLVIPHLKLSDKGLFDGDKFEFISKA